MHFLNIIIKGNSMTATTETLNWAFYPLAKGLLTLEMYLKNYYRY